MSNWALILGASTGHGGATAISLAEKGYGIIGFHFDRGETKKEAEKQLKKLANIMVVNVTTGIQTLLQKKQWINTFLRSKRLLVMNILS